MKNKVFFSCTQSRCCFSIRQNYYHVILVLPHVDTDSQNRVVLHRWRTYMVSVQRTRCLKKKSNSSNSTLCSGRHAPTSVLTKCSISALPVQLCHQDLAPITYLAFISSYYRKTFSSWDVGCVGFIFKLIVRI